VTDPTEVQRLRETFFRRTRRTAALLYAGLGLSAVGFGIAAIVSDPLRGAAGILAGLLLSLALSIVSPRLKTSARMARALVYSVPVVTVLILGMTSADNSFDSPAVLGALAGFFAGSIVGIALIRRRLVTDDALLLRQRSLGFDPEHPYGWLRGKQ
jgi:sulfite exporter TauE/SafE